MSTKQENLTPAEQRYLEYARAAESEGVKLARYYRSKGLSVYALYNIRRRLIRKGVIARARAPWSTRGRKNQTFVPVRVTKPVASSGNVCRLRHPSGWVLECGSWPEASWMRSLTGERS